MAGTRFTLPKKIDKKLDGILKFSMNTILHKFEHTVSTLVGYILSPHNIIYAVSISVPHDEVTPHQTH